MKKKRNRGMEKFMAGARTNLQSPAERLKRQRYMREQLRAIDDEIYGVRTFYGSRRAQ